MQRDEQFLAAVAKARQTERTIAAWLMARGSLVLPVYDYSGKGDDKAPKLTGASLSESLVAPDLLVSRDGSVRWVEVKEKDSASFTTITGQFETGISLRLWDQYVRVKASTGLDVWLVFAHHREDEIRGDEIGRLAPKVRRYGGHRMGRHGMAFFPYKELRLLGRLSDVKARYAVEAA